MKKYVSVMLFFCCLIGCSRHETAVSADSATTMTSMPASMAPVGRMAGAAEPESPKQIESSSSAQTNEYKKYIAMRHHLTIEIAAKDMQAAFNATVARCEQLKCQMLSANYNRETPYQPPSASMSVRVPPQVVDAFIAGLANSAEITQHHRESEDKTDQVIDAEARIKNLTEFRDSLRAMLSDKSAKFKDLIEVQRELVNTQSQLDSMQGLRKVLAQETDLVAVNINFIARQGITERGFFAPVAQALKNAGHVLMESIANVITFIMGTLPWLLFGIPLLILTRKFWVKIKARW